MAANLVANLIRYKREGHKPDRDIIVALTADEEIGGRWGIQWLVKNRRSLIDAEFALNEEGGVTLRNGKPFRVNVQSAEKITVNFPLEVTNKGGHSSLPSADNAIYRLSEGLTRLSNQMPVRVNHACGLSQAARPQYRWNRTTLRATASLSIGPLIAGCCQASFLHSCLLSIRHGGSARPVGAGRGCGDGASADGAMMASLSFANLTFLDGFNATALMSSLGSWSFPRSSAS
jgi:acetylornithine deacetylase/succinyl-diaminopimelate desuccinylase-like protein